jgi:hypothetical protein
MRAAQEENSAGSRRAFRGAAVADASHLEVGFRQQPAVEPDPQQSRSLLQRLGAGTGAGAARPLHRQRHVWPAARGKDLDELERRRRPRDTWVPTDERGRPP